MKQLLIPFFTTYIPLILLDVVWLSATAPVIYKPLIGHLMAPAFTMWPALIFYPLYALALAVFVVIPNVQITSLSTVLALGGFFGLTAYGAYDLTNQATLRDWPVLMTIIDMAWGMTVSALASVTSVMILRRFF